MKVLIVNTVKFRENGVTAVIMNYYKNMDKSNIQIDFVVINDIAQKFRNEIEHNGSKIFHISRNRNPISYMIKLKKVIKDGNYDIVHIHGNSAMMLLDMLPSIISGTKVRIAHSHNTTCDHLIAHKLLNPFFQKSYTHALACSDEAGKWLFTDKPFTVLKNSIDSLSFSYNETIRNEYRKKINAEDKKVIGHVGNFLPQKNHIFLLESFVETLKKDNNCLLLLLGTGLLFDEMKQKAKELGIQDSVIFQGVTFDVNNYMQAMDLFVFPSLFEGLGIVMLEAQASGLPCLASTAVPVDAKMLSSTEFLAIDDTKLWGNKMATTNIISNRKNNSETAIKELTENGYDIKNNAENLVKFYYNTLK